MDDEILKTNNIAGIATGQNRKFIHLKKNSPVVVKKHAIYVTNKSMPITTTIILNTKNDVTTNQIFFENIQNFILNKNSIESLPKQTNEKCCNNINQKTSLQFINRKFYNSAKLLWISDTEQQQSNIFKINASNKMNNLNIAPTTSMSNSMYVNNNSDGNSGSGCSSSSGNRVGGDSGDAEKETNSSISNVNLSRNCGYRNVYNSGINMENKVFDSCSRRRLVSVSDETDFSKSSMETQKNNTANSVYIQIKPQQKLQLNDSDKEVIDMDKNLVYRDGILVSGSLDTLIKHLVPTCDYFPDKSYIFSFLLSSRLFIQPYEILNKMCQICDIQQKLNTGASGTSIAVASAATTTVALASGHGGRGGDGPSQLRTHPVSSHQCLDGQQQQQHHQHQQQHHQHQHQQQQQQTSSQLSKFANNFVNFLSEWIETFPYDFRDERLMDCVRTMSQKCINIDPNLRKSVSQMLQSVLHHLTTLDQYEEYLARISNGETNINKGNNSSISSSSGGGGGACSSNYSSAGSHNVLSSTNTTVSSSSYISTHIPTLLSHPIVEAAGSSSGICQTTYSISNNTTGSYNNYQTDEILASGDLLQLCPSPTNLAQQLAHVEMERLSHIGPEEFVQTFVKENSNSTDSTSPNYDTKKTRNFESYIQWFNRLSYLVATEIVKHSKKKQRVRVIEYWIETARESFNIGNFNSLMAIIAGLNMSSISRLKKTWTKVQSAKFLVLEHQMDPTSNFNSYRLTLKAAMWRSAGATDERQRIVIPFFSLLVKDLYFLNEGCSNKLPNGHINFDKFWQLSEKVSEFISWKQVSCKFDKLPNVIEFLETSLVLQENALALASFDCESPENQHEKQIFKTLKSEAGDYHGT